MVEYDDCFALAGRACLHLWETISMGELALKRE